MEVSAIIMGQRVRAARQAKKMKTEELTEKVNIAVESIGHIECGARKPSLNLLFNIAEVLEVSLDYLTGRTPTTNEAIIHEFADHNDLYNSRDCGDTERDYQTGFNYLLTVLTEEQQAALNHMEGAYLESRYYAAEYGFKCGLYGAFRQFFGCSEAKDGGFQDLVTDDLLVHPSIQRHHKNYENIELCNNIDAEIMETLTENDQEHMVAVACAWQQRVYSAAMDGFYCGYRSAYEIMGTIDPLVKVRCVDRILTMEYYLGYIKSYSEVEQLQHKAG